MKFVLTNYHTGPEPIEKGEAINRLVAAGAVLTNAVDLINNLPCGFAIQLPDGYGEGDFIERVG